MSTLPAGVLTAIPQKLGERIRTPSITACPPTLTVTALLFVLAGESVLEPLHPTTRVHDALPARVERVANRTNFQVYVLARRRARLERIAAHAPHDRIRILRMYARLHQNLRICYSVLLLILLRIRPAKEKVAIPLRPPEEVALTADTL